MNILVVGNGFDLAHGLPTKYWDFMMFIKSFKEMEHLSKDKLLKLSEFKRLNADVQNYLTKDEVFNKDNRSDIVKELSQLISNNVWIEYFDDKIQSYENKGWIDFESEISDVVQALDYYIEWRSHYLKNNGTNFDKKDDTKESLMYEFLICLKKTTKLEVEKININYFYGDSLKEIIDELNNHLNGLIRCLEIYITEIIEKIDEYKKIKQIQDLSIDKLISFNYTNTYKNLYEPYGNKVEYDYLHGKADVNRDIKENNMVLGIEEYLKGEDRDNKLELVEFKKYFQRIYKKTGCKHKEWLESVSESQKNQGDNFLREGIFLNNIYIYGHSLDVTDKDILEDLLSLPYTQTTIFYLDKRDYAQKISNMIKIIGQDELTNSVYGKNPKIVFQEIQK
ncbi:bacteriophage abortive infection AbiH family protein [Clostridium perfringens]|uniref:AbiH family protein n=1 Tax=Clostridium perfringens TaxID=1502 RepID=UPI0013E3FD4E|nr:AbiH family protein [Clostridium perfringens]EJT6492901.1 bacteriophage abortive infection AbiH family protein [Clostridium perfringens]ELC8343602.1 bacteriophage abortive infection AbiH family protein [Clostridium perfringens]ELC8385789.1 bacteriophage abortive infection AbiH family protein [Clostridium perfringens]MBI6081245.1 bacteriophage abortive infection AbiH family protein [Clostridium perfringens]MDK0646436.1 AbiH family protein [Clostridium perfringens]